VDDRSNDRSRGEEKRDERDSRDGRKDRARRAAIRRARAHPRSRSTSWRRSDCGRGARRVSFVSPRVPRGATLRAQREPARFRRRRAVASSSASVGADAPASFRRRRPAASFERRASRAPPLRRARRYRARLTAASSSRPPREGRRRVDRVAAQRALSPAAVARDASARGIRDSAGVREALQVRGEEPEEHRRPRGPAALLPSSQEGARGLEHASPRRDARRARPPQLVARERRKKPRRRHSSRSRRSLSLASAIERSPSRDATTTHARR
jgi:hypothetical protein